MELFLAILYLGELDGMVGIFPKSYVKIIKDTNITLQVNKKPDIN